MHINSSKDIDSAKMVFITDALSFKDSYLLTENEIEYFTNELEKLYENEDLLNNCL